MLTTREIGFCLALLILPAGFAQEPGKPACKAETLGRFWPAEANHDRATFAKATRCGELEMCVRGMWHYHWRSLSVRLDQLTKNTQMPKPATCMAESDSRDRTASTASPADEN